MKLIHPGRSSVTHTDRASIKAVFVLFFADHYNISLDVRFSNDGRMVKYILFIYIALEYPNFIKGNSLLGPCIKYGCIFLSN